MPYKVYIIAGEASGDALGAKLLHAMQLECVNQQQEVEWRGIGGKRMLENGLKQSLFPMEELSVMGFVEVLKHARHFKKRIRETVQDIAAYQPDLVITIDSPGFCTRVIKQLDAVPEVTPIKLHYVAPTVWAYKPKRAEKFAKLFDHLLLLLPFEPPYFDAVGLENSFIGHPVVEEDVATQQQADAFRSASRIPEDAPLLCMLSGSRHGELKRLMPVYAGVVELLQANYPDLQIVLPTVPHLHDEVVEQVKGWPAPCHVITEAAKKQAAYVASDVAIAKSGTATLELAMAALPMVVTYKVHPFSAWLLKRMIKTPFVNLVNILLQKEAIPELLQEEATDITLYGAVHKLLEQPEEAIKQVNAMNEALMMLRKGEQPPPSQLAAQHVLRLLSNASSD